MVSAAGFEPATHALNITLMHGLDVRRFASATDMSFGIAIVMAVLVFVGFLVSSVRLLRRMDVP